jgi:ketosteroid isomerase-like protein
MALELIERLVERWNAGDPEDMVALCDPDVVVRPDPAMRVIEGIAHGVDATLAFIDAQREAMGLGQLTVLERHDFGPWAAARVRQQIHSASGVESEWEWTVIITARDGKIVMIEFFVDEAAARRAAGLPNA